MIYVIIDSVEFNTCYYRVIVSYKESNYI
ncbi:unnamed protein product [Debaryomyces tyrocola]|nr:unnamed protein product [Debaryomyces tyrocola]